MEYFVIEHPTRGWFIGNTYEYLGKAPYYSWKPKFAYSIQASDKKVKRMFSKAEIDKELDRMPEKIRSKCNVKSSNLWTKGEK